MKIDNGMTLQIEGLCKNYPSFSLENVSFSIPKGSIMGLIGVNGAGKSTTMKAVLGLIRPSGGEIALLGKPLDQVDNSVRERIGVVFDEFSYVQTIKIPQLNRVLSGIYREWDSARFLNLCEQFRLPSNKPFKEYSRGMKMKLSVAAALSHRAKLLILDEPTSGLDPLVRNEILDLFLEYIQDGENSILISSHITGDLEKIADYITFLDNGRVVVSESKDELIYSHAVAKGNRRQIDAIPEDWKVSVKENRYDCEALVRLPDRVREQYPDLVVDRVNLEDLMLFLVGKQSA